MKLSLNIEFDNWEEYLDFSAKVLPEARSISSATSSPVQKSVSQPKPPALVQETVQAASTAKPGFTPSPSTVEKVQQFIRQGKPFHTKDVVDAEVMLSSKRRTKVNQWLQQIPELSSAFRKKDASKGKGPLLYTPIQRKDGAILLPPGKPGKTIWPIKGANIKKNYVPPLEDEEEEQEDMLDQQTLSPSAR